MNCNTVNIFYCPNILFNEKYYNDFISFLQSYSSSLSQKKCYSIGQLVFSSLRGDSSLFKHKLIKKNPLVNNFMEIKRNSIDESILKTLLCFSTDFIVFYLSKKPVLYNCEKCNLIHFSIYDEETTKTKTVFKDTSPIPHNNTYKLSHFFMDNLDINAITRNDLSGNISPIFTPIKEEKDNNIVNVLYYDSNINYRPEDIYKDCNLFEEKIKGTFIFCGDENSFNIITNEIAKKNNVPDLEYKFVLIINGTSYSQIINNINKDNEKIKIFKDLCIYTFKEKISQQPKNEMVFTNQNEILNFLHKLEKDKKYENNQKYKTTILIDYDRYIKKFNLFHSVISKYYDKYSQNSDMTGRKIILDFLNTYSEKLMIELNEDIGDEEEKKKELSKTLELFEKLTDKKNGNLDDIIKIIWCYTKEKNSFYKDFNKWLRELDPLIYEKIGFFISGLMFSLDSYGHLEDKHIKELVVLYRGKEMSYIDLIQYKRFEYEIITIPTFVSTSKKLDIAKVFSIRNKTAEKRKEEGLFSVIFTIENSFVKSSYPLSTNISGIAEYPSEEEVLIQPFTFYRVNKVDINFDKYTSEIKLTTICKKEVLEYHIQKGKNIIYNKFEGALDLEGSDKLFP